MPYARAAEPHRLELQTNDQSRGVDVDRPSRKGDAEAEGAAEKTSSAEGRKSLARRRSS